MKPLPPRRGVPCKKNKMELNYANRQAPAPSRDEAVGGRQRARKRKNKRTTALNTTPSRYVTSDEPCTDHKIISKENYKKIYVNKKNNSNDKVNNSNVPVNNMLVNIPLLMCRRHTYTGDEKMNQMVEVLRKSAPAENYIAQCTTMSDIGYMRRSPSWNRISREFSHIEVSRQPDGIYMFPTFHGHYNAGHWYLTVLQKRASLWFGWTVDSLPIGLTNRAEYAKKIIAKVVRQKIIWKGCKCLKQEEVECGPRTICHILAIIQQNSEASIESVLKSFKSESYLTTEGTSLCTASRQICERILNLLHSTPNIPIKLVETEQIVVSNSALSTKTNVRRVNRSKVVPVKLRPRLRNKERKHALVNNGRTQKKTVLEHRREAQYNQTEASYPTAISRITSVFSHVRAKDGLISHLIAFYKFHKVQINTNHVKLLTTESRRICEEYINSTRSQQTDNDVQIIDLNMSLVAHTKKKPKAYPDK